MSENKYTPEPWEIIEPLPPYEKGQIVGVVGISEKVIVNLRDFKGKEKHANAKRIVECVNALAGVGDVAEFMAECLTILDQSGKHEWARAEDFWDRYTRLLDRFPTTEESKS